MHSKRLRPVLRRHWKADGENECGCGERTGEPERKWVETSGRRKCVPWQEREAKELFLGVEARPQPQTSRLRAGGGARQKERRARWEAVRLREREESSLWVANRVLRGGAMTPWKERVEEKGEKCSDKEEGNWTAERLTSGEREDAVQKLKCSGLRVGCSCADFFKTLLCERCFLVSEFCKKVDKDDCSSSFCKKLNFNYFGDGDVPMRTCRATLSLVLWIRQKHFFC